MWMQCLRVVVIIFVVMLGGYIAFRGGSLLLRPLYAAITAHEEEQNPSGEKHAERN